MISIVIPTQGNESETVATLSALVPGSAAGMVRDVVLVDRGGAGDIARVADDRLGNRMKIRLRLHGQRAEVEGERSLDVGSRRSLSCRVREKAADGRVWTGECAQGHGVPF